MISSQSTSTGSGSDGYARGSLRAACATATADAWTETITRTTTRASTDATTPARSPSADASRKLALVARSLALGVWRLGAPLICSACESHDTDMVVTRNRAAVS